MSVEVVREPEAGPPENCAICRRPTLFWYEAKDVAVCRDCAAQVTPDDIPSKKAWIESEISRRGRRAHT